MTSSEKVVTLLSHDGEEFVIPVNVAEKSELIKNMLNEFGDDKVVVPLPNVKSATLVKVLEYCKKHAEHEATAEEDGGAANKAGAGSEELKRWDDDFLKVENEVLLEIILAANYMNIKSLLESSCQAIADNIKNKSPEYFRRLFKIRNDFRPHEEEEIRKENQWAFDDIED